MLGITIIPEKYKPKPKKKLVTFGNCHFNEILKNLTNYQYVINNCMYSHISINAYVDNCAHGYLRDRSYFTNEHIELLKKADVLIYQNIETDRGFLNNKEVLKLIKPNCIKIKIPHYRSSVYHYSWYEEPYFEKMREEVNKITSIKEKIEYIKKYIADINNKKYDAKKLDEFIDKQLMDFKKIDSYSDISMYDYFVNNYKKIQLINGRSYPTSYFFFILSKKILEKLNIYENLSFTELIRRRTAQGRHPIYFSKHTNFPIFNFWYKYNNFTFEKQFYWEGEYPIKDYEFYYLQIKAGNDFTPDSTFCNIWMIRSKFNALEKVKKLRNLINNT